MSGSYEEFLVTDCAASRRLAALLSRAASETEAVPGGSDDRNVVLSAIARLVIAPVLLSFVLWALDEARSASLRQLYFCSRDAQILLKLARLVAAATEVPCELRYLYGSRQSLRMATFSDQPGVIQDWALMGTSTLTLRSVLVRTGLAPQDVFPALSVGGRAYDLDAPMSRAERRRLSKILHQPALEARMRRTVEAQRSAVMTYLRQEGLGHVHPWGIVDLGWHGRTYEWLCQLVAGIGGSAPTGLLLGLEAMPSSGTSKADLKACLFDNRASKDVDSAQVIPVLEAFCSADHGKVVSFSTSTLSRSEPQLLPECMPLDQLRVVRVVHESILDFARRVLQDPCRDALLDASARPAALRLLDSFVHAPTREEAAACSLLLYDEDPAGVIVRPLASPYGLDDLWNALVRRREVIRGGADWLCGSLALTEGMIGMVMRRTIAFNGRCGRRPDRAGVAEGRRFRDVRP